MKTPYHTYLSIWTLTSDGTNSVPIAHETLLASIAAKNQQDPPQEILDRLITEGLVENDVFGRYFLSAQGLAFWKLTPAEEQSNRPVVSTDAEWDDFRKYLAYYIDCITTQEKQAEYLFAEQQKKSFLQAHLPIGWLRLLGENDKREITITVSRSDASAKDFILGSKIDNEEIYIGYPLALLRTKRGALCYSPMALLPVTVTNSSYSTITMQLHYEDCELNQSWFEYNVPRERQRPLRNQLHPSNENSPYSGLFDLYRSLPFFESELGPSYSNIFDPNCLDISLPENNSQKACNAAILFVGKSLRYSKTLKSEMEYILKNATDEELDNTALAYVFRKHPLLDESSMQHYLPLPFIDSNHEQQLAVENALNYPLSKITGPPGTGKSQVAVNIIANLQYLGRSTLFTSKNRKAVLAIAERSAQVLGNDNVPLVNFCTGHDGNITNPWFKQNLEMTIADFKSKENLLDPTTICDVENACREWEDAEMYLSGRNELLRQTSRNTKSIASLTKRLCSLLHVKTDICLKALQINKLMKYGENISKTSFDDITWRHPVQKIIWHLYGKKLHEIALKNLKIEFPELFQRLHDHRQLRHVIFEALSLWRELQNELQKAEELKKNAKNAPDLSALVTEFGKTMADLHKAIKPALLFKRMQIVLEHADDIEFLKFLKSVMDIFKNMSYPTCMETLTDEQIETSKAGCKAFYALYPSWAVTLQSVSKASPCFPAIFDTVIIDEASQCDIPPIIPALYRARRLVVIGDPNQFPPVINLSPQRHDYLKKMRHKLNFINDQCFDYMDFNAYSCVTIPPTMLREHFRCDEDIIAYCNNEYYSKQLIVRTDRNRLNFPKNMGYHSGVEWYDVPNSQEAEIKLAVHHVEMLRQNGFEGSIGVITPFHEIVSRLKQALYQKLPEEDINTVNGFQGGERDLIIFVLAYTPNSPKGQQWYATAPENRYLFNVAVSRARACLLIIGDREYCRKSPCHHLQSLAELPHQRPANQFKPFDSIWEERFYDALVSAGLKPQPQYPVAGRRLDLGLLEGDFKLDVEVDGVQYHTNANGERNTSDLFRDLQLESLGWHVQRFWVYELNNNMEACVEKVKRIIHEHHT
ncbi:MAG: AAA domain-containing protein [Lentisphaeria bacterium]|nr:AAA domain-containing protein [Lentisphaeria bacterium]